MRIKRGIALLLAMILCLAVFTGCGEKGKEDETGGKSKNTEVVDKEDKEDKDESQEGSPYEVTEPITIEWWHAQEAQYAELIDSVVEQFHETDTKVTLEPVYQGSYTELNEKLIAALAADTAPALSVANTPYVAEYGASGVCEVLTPYIEADDFDIDDFGIGLIESSSYDGEPISLPFLISTQVMYYNKDMAEAEGIELPETWDEMDEFMDAAAKVTNGETERFATCVPGWDQWYFETYYRNSGVEIVTSDNTTDLDGSKAMEIAEQFKKWYKEGKIDWCYGTGASTNMRQAFFDGKAFSVMHTSSLYEMYVENCDFEVGMHYYPGADTRYSEVGGCVLLMPAKNDQKVKNAAWEAMKFLMSKDVNMQWADGSGYMPTRKSVLETEEAEAFLEKKPAFQAVFDNLDNIKPRIQHPAYPALSKIWLDSMAKAIIEDADMTATMEEAAKLINEALADY